MQKPPNIEFRIPNTDTVITLIHLPEREKNRQTQKYEVVGYKPYMEVSQRLVWFNLVSDRNTIETEVEREWEIPGAEGQVVYVVRFKAIIRDHTGRIIRTARKTREVNSPKDFETCETGAIGRVLALAGFGTQYATQDMEENEDIADAPAYLKKEVKPTMSFEEFDKSMPTHAPPKQKETVSLPYIEIHPLSYEKAISGTFTGKTFKEIFETDKNQGFKYTKARFKDLKENKNNSEWVIKYMTYAQDIGVSL